MTNSYNPMDFPADTFLQFPIRRDISPSALFMLGFTRVAEAREARIQTLQARLDSQATADPALVAEIEEETEQLDKDRNAVRCLASAPDSSVFKQ